MCSEKEKKNLSLRDFEVFIQCQNHQKNKVSKVSCTGQQVIMTVGPQKLIHNPSAVWVAGPCCASAHCSALYELHLSYHQSQNILSRSLNLLLTLNSGTFDS